MKTYTIDELPRHTARPLTAEARAELPPLAITHDTPAKGFVQASAPNEGDWVLSPEHMNGDDPMTDIRYRPFWGGRSYEELVESARGDPVERFRVHQMLMGSELGSVWSQAKALELLECARRTVFEGNADEQLRAGGFLPETTPGFYRRKHGRDSYAVLVRDTGNVWLMFEPHGKTHWHNLLILNRATPLQEEGKFFPIYWPETVNDPLAAMAGLAVHMSRIWTPDLLPGRSARTKRKAAP